MTKRKTAKTQVGYPLEVQFTEHGYILLWDSRVRMSAAEYRFFCSYLKDSEDSLLYLAAVNSQKFRTSSPSLRFLHTFALDFLRTAAASEDISELTATLKKRTEEIANSIEKSGKVPLSFITHTYSGLIRAIAKKNKPLHECVEDIYKQTVAAVSVTFSIEEIQNSDTPYRLLITCKYGNSELPLRETVAILSADGNANVLDSVSFAIKNLAKKSELMKAVYNDGAVLDSYALSLSGMHTFLKELEMYSMYGITCRIPNHWKKRRSTLTLGMLPIRRTAQIGTDAILNFDINLSIDGEKLTPEEIESLMQKDETLFMFRGKWVELNRSEMHSCLAVYESLLENGSELTLADAMRAMLSPDKNLPDGEEYVLPEFDLGDDAVLENLRDREDSSLPCVSEPSEYFTATLRPYQADGVRWLNFMRKMGLGACLSDDMGLGKTVQAIAVLEQIRQLTGGRSLVIIPASLLKNWQNEIAKFAPFMKVRVLHNSCGTMSIEKNDDSDIFITTYAMLSRLTQLRNIMWDCIILDEAQAIKNPQTLQSKSAKRLNARFKIAMTGTPIENSITDLWSIFDFLNPGLFHSTPDYLMGITDMDNAASKLRKFVSPFILRRLKTDKSIISDLPEKIEMKNYCTLTQRQAILYKQVVNSLSEEIGYSHGMERRGLVLSGLLRLKQICNHPDQYTGQGTYQVKDSGKMSRLIELCEEIKERRERVLVFTQFKEMCEPLANALYDLFGVRGLVIHGSTGIGERGEIVESFNNPQNYIPYIVLSLRAGGVGLNLTAANHVIHFDRWWNPAVENQATDRAFRIGQTNNVIVHKLICTGTLEEKIDELIERKSDMATGVVENNVNITELSDDEILSLLHMDDI
ncbi:MAG: DEAD/DEAH box helicase [Clostridia bacterium]|nr:DEAD/DEAH box helicase [Clostridia bacterium]